MLNTNFKKLYKTMIDEILHKDGLTNLCTLYFDNQSQAYCNNCLFDKATEISSNIYNGTGPKPFVDYTTCPVCMGSGKTLTNTKTKNLYVAVLFDTKTFIGLNNKLVNIPEGSIQTICSSKYSTDLKACSYLIINSYPETKYERSGDVNPIGLGDLEYIFLNWRRV